MKQRLLIITLLSALLAFGCSEEKKTTNTAASHNTGSADTNTSQKPTDDSQNPTENQTEQTKSMLQAKIDDTLVTIQWEDNDAVKSLIEMASKFTVIVNMSQYGGFEQVGPLDQSLPHTDVQTTTEPGDIVLYSGNQIVVFYGSNSWSYTKLGHINMNQNELNNLLDKENVTVTIK